MEEGLLGPIICEYDVTSPCHVGADGHEQKPSEEDNWLHVKGRADRLLQARAFIMNSMQKKLSFSKLY
jgi:hypothetical protein